MTYLEKEIGLLTSAKDRETVMQIIELLKQEDVTVDRASKILSDAQILIPLITKLKW